MYYSPCYPVPLLPVYYSLLMYLLNKRENQQQYAHAYHIKHESLN
ncbi:hypothetical protein [Snodgrassella communis]|nr:hypothetical protein [Snodgrassella communis]